MVDIIAIITFSYYVISGGYTVSSGEKPAAWLGILFFAVNVAAMISGYKYLRLGYSKEAARFYKAFMIIQVVANLFGIMAMLFTDWNMISLCLETIKIVALLVLAFGKDLGKRNTWIVFSVLLVIDLVIAFAFKTGSASLIYRIPSSFTRLLLDGTIGLAIMGKYHDKDQRGTV